MYGFTRQMHRELIKKLSTVVKIRYYCYILEFTHFVHNIRCFLFSSTFIFLFFLKKNAK